MSRLTRFSAAIAAGAAALLVLSACASNAPAEPEAPATDGTTAEAPALETITPGKLTIATGEPAYAPWVLNNDPSSGEGFEAAVAYAVAEELGFAAADVVWVGAAFEASIAPGPKDWDLNIQQFSITDERKQAVDFSSPYYVTTQAVVANAGNAAASATTVAELADAEIGVASGTTSLTVAEEVLGTDNLKVYNSVDDLVQALQSDQIDALVTDLPGAFYVRDAQLDDGVIVGQLESSQGGDEFAFVLPKGSALTAAVTAAVDALRDNGTLDQLAAEWIAEQGAPVLK